MTLTADHVEAVRAVLADEWAAANPQTPDEITEFYVNAQGLEDDLNLFHSLPERQEWTETLVTMAKRFDARLVIDIGSGAGHDLRALRDAGVNAVGIEPNKRLRRRCDWAGLLVYRAVESTPIEDAQILNCIDVLEHIPDPETWLGEIAERASIGTYLFETCAVWDAKTPLHLPSNRGWAPGRCLETHGFKRLGMQGRLSMWRKVQDGPIAQTHLVVCAGERISVATHRAILALMKTENGSFNWIPSEATEAGLLRARSNWVSKWYRDTCGDVCLLVDADIRFQPQDAMHLVQVAREKRSIVVAAYPTKDGHNLTIKPLEDTGTLTFGPDAPPLEIRWGATGFMAIHRDVLDAIIPTLPLCSPATEHAFWPVFNLDFVRDELPDGSDDWQLMGEDFTICERARNQGFRVWMDPTIQIDHMSGLVPVNYMNMDRIRALGEIPSD